MQNIHANRRAALASMVLHVGLGHSVGTYRQGFKNMKLGTFVKNFTIEKSESWKINAMTKGIIL